MKKEEQIEKEEECPEDHADLIEQGFIGCPYCEEYFGND